MEEIVLYNIIIVVVACFMAMIMEMMMLPRIIYIAKKKRLFDLPDSRKRHGNSIPRLGGMTFTPVILLIGLLSIFIRIRLHIWSEIEMEVRIPEVILFVCGLLIIYLLGAKDDLVGVGFKKKFLIQFVASFFIVGSGVYINNMYGILGIYEIPDWIGIILSVGLVIFTTNALNLIDGADGLASGISVVALVVFGIMFSIYGMWTYTGIAFIVIGVLIPFFYYNFFHPTRKIFMGDTGSLTLGYLLAFMVLRLAKHPPFIELVPSGLLLLIMSALFIPLFDALKVMIVRASMGKSPFSPDRNHIHHKLIDLGLSKKKAVCAIIMTAIALVMLNWMLLYSGINCNIVLLVDITLGTTVNVLIYRQTRLKMSKGALRPEIEEMEMVEESIVKQSQQCKY